MSSGISPPLHLASCNEAAQDISADELQLRAQGHVQELPRQFSTFSILSLSFSITNSWIGYSAVFATPLYSGGGPGVIYCLLGASVACSFITAGLAELASAFPSAGGQYHFAYMVASPRWRAFVAFVTGWMSVFAWLFTTASACIFCAQICVNLANFFHEDYISTQWQIYLIYVAFVAACTLITIFLPKQIPIAETVFFIASVAGFLVFIVTVLGLSETKQSAKTIFVEWVNETGWNDGAAFLLGTGQAMYTFLAVDSASHIAEEVPNPSRTVPHTMGMTVLIGIVTVIPWTLAFMFSTQAFDTVRSNAVPIMEVYYQTLRHSKPATAVFTTWLVFIYFGACLACTVTTGRLVWALARDKGMVYSTTFGKVHSGLKVPVNATVFTGIFCALYGLIYIGSTTAFNSFIATAILFLNITYAIPQAFVLFNGRKKTLPARYLDLGPVFGPICNLFSTLWVSLFTVIFCLPTFLPVTIEDMNYVSVIIAGVCLFIALLWFLSKRKSFTGPDVLLDGIETIAVAAPERGNDKL